MGLYGDKKDYEEIVKENIEKARLLYSVPEENREQLLQLLTEKENIIKKNGLFASFQLKKINKKINKLKSCQ